MGRRMFLDFTRVVLRATTLDQLRDTGVRWPVGPKGLGRKLECSVILEDFKHMHSVFLSDFGVPLDDRIIWTKKLANIFGLSPSPEQAQILCDGLDAFHTYRESLGKEIKNGWDAASKPNDQMDLHQLFYLSDPGVVLVTNDKNIGSRVKSSSQANRVVTLDDLLSRESLSL